MKLLKQQIEDEQHCALLSDSGTNDMCIQQESIYEKESVCTLYCDTTSLPPKYTEEKRKYKSKQQNEVEVGK